MQLKPKLLTGDTPTGGLHLGHWIGSLENRVALQKQYNCYFIIANMQALSTHIEHPDIIKKNVIEVALDYLAVGIDPEQSHIFIQSEIPALAELTFLFSMLVSYPRLMRNPTIKEEIANKGLGNNYSVGFFLYPISQVADILGFRPEIVPAGEDQDPHLELCREVARRFNQLFCGVNPQTADNDYLKVGGLFPIVKNKHGRSKRLVGLGPPNEQGQLLKMSKSLNNAIFLSDSNDIISQKVMRMYTDPQRIHATDKGKIKNNPLWIFHDTFNPDKAWVEEAKLRYQKGGIGDVECKKHLINVLIDLITPIRLRREQFANHLDSVNAILKKGSNTANEEVEQTLALTKAKLGQQYFKREIRLYG